VPSGLWMGPHPRQSPRVVPPGLHRGECINKRAQAELSGQGPGRRAQVAIAVPLR